jgi:hypothetical protein
MYKVEKEKGPEKEKKEKISSLCRAAALVAAQAVAQVAIQVALLLIQV